MRGAFGSSVKGAGPRKPGSSSSLIDVATQATTATPTHQTLYQVLFANGQVDRFPLSELNREYENHDAALGTVARQVIAKYYSQALRVADESTLRAYLQIVLDQLRGALAFSGQACGLLVQSQLDTTQVLSADLAHRELTLLRRLLESMDGATPEPVDEKQFAAVMDVLTQRIPESRR